MGPIEDRKRTEHSCDRCKSRKHKCHRIPGQPRCQHCQQHDYQCIITKPRKTASIRQRRSFRGLIPETDVGDLNALRAVGRSLGIPLPEDKGSAGPIQQPDSIDPLPKESKTLVHDRQGQGQYIGPASSYVFQMRLRTLLGRESQGRYGQMTLDELVRVYFDRVNSDFPVLHEAAFLETFDKWRVAPDSVDRAWLCSLLCVLILGVRAQKGSFANNNHSSMLADEQRWWSHVETLLPGVLFTSSVNSVQTLLLAALHLHNTNHRDACWTITGAAGRIAIAIGLHRDEIEPAGPRLARELRKVLWWTLYGFEQMQVSSHDRPSAIDATKCSTAAPRERILGSSGFFGPPDYILCWTQLVKLLGLVCRDLPTITTSAETYIGPLSPTASLLRDLSRWHNSLPVHLALPEAVTLPDAFRRPTLLLHIQYHYAVTLLTRYALLLYYQATLRPEESATEEIARMAKVCSCSGRRACELLLKLDEISEFNAGTWWDVYYLYSSTLVVTLSILCDQQMFSEPLVLLDKCTAMAERHGASNPMMPGTMQLWFAANTTTSSAQAGEDSLLELLDEENALSWDSIGTMLLSSSFETAVGALL
ncbi:hypothetical protein UA08_04734 [Talaromyces atroroseus]|uniref:Zn(2)-C6 fungal-type domain-containing protein n=1 Tax=Talaromyces atroroseus TaxID=1441469 RepID=A0A225AWC3_TALAT|nr:hypothetical protein UA08_04734 [Talaromyces atroroseus]OKL59919.1 hypothetical protein UA08_04734 [Talaromyces atroroseus]